MQADDRDDWWRTLSITFGHGFSNHCSLTPAPLWPLRAHDTIMYLPIAKRDKWNHGASVLKFRYVYAGLLLRRISQSHTALQLELSQGSTATRNCNSLKYPCGQFWLLIKRHTPRCVIMSRFNTLTQPISMVCRITMPAPRRCRLSVVVLALNQFVRGAILTHEIPEPHELPSEQLASRSRRMDQSAVQPPHAEDHEEAEEETHCGQEHPVACHLYRVSKRLAFCYVKSQKGLSQALRTHMMTLTSPRCQLLPTTTLKKLHEWPLYSSGNSTRTRSISSMALPVTPPL